jgi:hypothetical protein
MRFNELTEQRVEEGNYDLDLSMNPIDLSSNPSFKDIIQRYTQLVYQGHASETSPEEDQEYDAIEQYVAQRFGEKGSAHLQKAGETSYWGRDDGRGSGGHRSSNLGGASKPVGDFRTTKSGKMHGQDVKMMKSKVADRLGRHPAPALPESMEEGNLYSIALQRYPQLKQVNRETVISALNGAYEDYLMHYGYEGIGPDEESSMIDHAVKGLNKGVAEGQGDLATALSKISGSWSGWHKEEDMSSPDIDVYEYDDGEGGYYGRGTIEHNLKSGEVKVEYHDSENDADVVGNFKNMGDAMRALRGEHGVNHGGQAPNFDRLGQRKQHGPDDLRKTDRTGRKGTLAGGPTNSLKQAIQWNKGKHGPVGKLPETGNNYHANRMGFTKPSGHRDDERHDLDAPRPLIYGLKINGKIWKKDGNTVTFFTKERAMAAKNSMLNKRPELEITLVQRPQD